MTDDDLQAKEDAETREYYADQERERYEKRIADLLARIAALRDELACDVQNYWAKQKGKPMSCLEATRNRPLWCHNCQAIAADDEAQVDD
jgi:hypothetical protein